MLAHPPSPFEQKMKNQSNSDFQNQKTMAFGFSKKGNQLNYEPKAEINSDFQTALTCSSSNILLINLISSKQESQDDENYFLVTRRFNHMNINGCKIPGSSIQFNLMSHNHPSCFCGNDFYFCNVGRLFFFVFFILISWSVQGMRCEKVIIRGMRYNLSLIRKCIQQGAGCLLHFLNRNTNTTAIEIQ